MTASAKKTAASRTRITRRRPGASAAKADRARQFDEILKRLGPLDAPAPVAANAEGTLYSESEATKEASVTPSTGTPPSAPLRRARKVASNGLVVLTRPRSEEAERFRLLRARLLTTAPEKTSLMSIVGLGARSRAAYVAANLGASFAKTGRATLLIDADIGRPRLASVFPASRGGGLAAALAGAPITDVIVETGIEWLSVLHAGEKALRNPESLAAGALPALLENAQEKFDHVIVLTSPYGAAPDGQYVWAATRRAIVVARRGETRAKETRALAQIMRQIGAETLGAVITD